MGKRERKGERTRDRERRCLRGQSDGKDWKNRIKTKETKKKDGSHFLCYACGCGRELDQSKTNVILPNVFSFSFHFRSVSRI
jgi:hypothetical protein